MKITAVASSLLLLAPPALLVSGQYTGGEFYAIQACCDSGCDEACDWTEENPQVIVTSNCVREPGDNTPCPIRREFGRHLQVDQLRGDDLINANCCTTPKKASSSGDPHFKTWTGDKYDYHGECDLVLIDDPQFNNGQGLKVHIRTTRVKYFSFIEKAAVQIGGDILEFSNDLEGFLINGAKLEANKKHHKTLLGGFVVRRDQKALSIRLGKEARKTGHIAKIDLHTRKNGFPAIIIDAGSTDIFKGSLGLLGEWGTGRMLARDGKTEFTEVDVMDAEDFALEWQVRDTEPMLFQESRFPQFPVTCAPAKKIPKTRLGYSKQVEEAQAACSHWKEDKEDCLFDVLATRDVDVALEGHLVHVA